MKVGDIYWFKYNGHFYLERVVCVYADEETVESITLGTDDHLHSTGKVLLYNEPNEWELVTHKPLIQILFG